MGKYAGGINFVMKHADLMFEHIVDPTREFFNEYAKIPMLVSVRSKLQVEKIDRGIGGILLREVPVDPYIKDLGQYESPIEFSRQFDIKNWAFFAAYDQGRLVAAATVAYRTKDILLLDDRDDLCLLWDIRVDDSYKRQGVGSKLLEMAIIWVRGKGIRQMKIECQNINLPAVRFYHKFGAVLCAFDEYFYYNDPDCREEVALLWYLNLLDGSAVDRNEPS
jgi:GNAT superfamily N-acetyltransferase